MLALLDAASICCWDSEWTWGGVGGGAVIVNNVATRHPARGPVKPRIWDFEPAADCANIICLSILIPVMLGISLYFAVLNYVHVMGKLIAINIACHFKAY